MFFGERIGFFLTHGATERDVLVVRQMLIAIADISHPEFILRPQAEVLSYGYEDFSILLHVIF